jgi:hypothetical protein
MCASIGSNIDKKAETKATSTARISSTVEKPTPTTAAIPKASLTTEVRDGKFAFVVTRFNTSDVAGDPNNPFMEVKPQGMFVNVYMTVTNIGGRPQTFFASNQKLFAGGREFGPNTMAAVWTGNANVEINPGNSIDAVVSFDVPLGITVDTVELHDSAFSGGAKLRIG